MKWLRELLAPTPAPTLPPLPVKPERIRILYPPFAERPTTCKKCGSDARQTPTFHRAWESPPSEWVELPTWEYPDHLIWTCAVCGHKTSTLTADADTPPP